MALRCAVRSLGRVPVGPMRAMAPRTFSTFNSVQNLPREDVVARLDALHSEVLGSNWGDYFNLIQDGPFWDAELERIDHFVQPYLSDPEVGAKVKEVHNMMDCLAQVEDCRDFMNEVGELCTRASGLMGTGANAGEKVENLEELQVHCAEFYEEMLVKYPMYKPKVEQTLGHGLAILRQKGKFRFGQMHRYMF